LADFLFTLQAPTAKATEKEREKKHKNSRIIDRNKRKDSLYLQTEACGGTNKHRQATATL
jgi:hypothetical protein